MRYLLLIGSENKTAAPPSPAEGQAMVQAFMRFSEEVRAAGKAVVSEPLRHDRLAGRAHLLAEPHEGLDHGLTLGRRGRCGGLVLASDEQQIAHRASSH